MAGGFQIENFSASMGCFQSKVVVNVEECPSPPPLENEGRVGIHPASRRNTAITPHSSSASEISNYTTTTIYRPVEQAVRQIEAGRVGILPPPTMIISSSSSSSSSSLDEQQLQSIKGRLADDEEDSSSFGSDVNAPTRIDGLVLPDAANTNQSMDDLLKDESVVDWLAETTNNKTTKETMRGPPKSVMEQNHQFEQQQHQKQYPIIASKELYEYQDDCHVVKDTARVERRHVPLPTDKPVEIKSGSWVTNRYVVNDYIMLSDIGKGAHAEVRLCKHKRTNEVYAAKIMNKKLLCEKFVDIQKEVAIMKKLMHPNILRLYEVLDDPNVNKIYLITEFAQRGDLMNIARTYNLTDDHLRSITRQIMMGLQYLHDNFITHNDLKPSNILLTQDGTVKIADFGVSGLGRIRMDSCGTPSFMAPEVVSGEPHDGQLADCYSLGATLYCVKFGKPPFVGKGYEKHQQMKDLYDQIKTSPLIIPPVEDGRLGDLLFRLMTKDPMDRLRLSDALNHCWIQVNVSSS